MTTLQQYFETERTLSQTRKDKAQNAFAAAQKAASDARTAQEAQTAAAAAKLSEIAGLRREIAAAATPADMDALLADLRTALVELRHLRRLLLDAQLAQAAAEAGQEQAGAANAAATAGLATATDAAQREADRRKKLDAWIAALAVEPLASVATKAQAVLAGQLFQDAQTTGQEIPTKLRTRTLARLQAEIASQTVEQTSTATAEADLAKAAESDAGLAWDAFLARADSLGAWVNGAIPRLDQAAGLLERAKGAHLSADEKQYLADHPAPDAALDLEDALDTARADRDAAAVALDKKRVEVLLGGGDPETDPALDPLKLALSQAEGDLTQAETDFAAQRTVLETWEAAAPDAVWDGLAAFDRAGRILNELKTGPGTRVTDLNNAETTLVTALQKETRSGRTLDFLRARAATLRGRLSRTENLREPRIARAARGDA
jgi:hypothetical protein